MTTKLTSDETIEPADLLDENGNIDINKVRSRAQSGLRNSSAALSKQTCIRIRARLKGSKRTKEVAERLGVSKDTVAVHARGECNCEHNHATLEKAWYPTADVPGGSEKLAVPAAFCREFRRRLRNGETARDVDQDTTVGRVTIRHHAYGRCTHGPDAHDERPLAHGWHEVDDE